MSKVLAEGHRGYCSEYPENTMISFEAALDLPVDSFEFDIWLTSDKVPVLMHDGNCLRTCGVDKHLRDMTYEEVKTLDAGYRKKFGEKYMNQGIGVPTLEEALQLMLLPADSVQQHLAVPAAAALPAAVLSAEEHTAQGKI